MSRKPNPNLPLYAKNLGIYRRKANLTQKELANKLLLSESGIRKWENGQRLPEFKQLIAYCMNVKADIYKDILQEQISTPEFTKKYIEEPFQYYIRMLGKNCSIDDYKIIKNNKMKFVLIMGILEYNCEKEARRNIIIQYINYKVPKAL